MAKVSIIMPTYNVEKYFIKCLESVINQTLSDIEIIPVDDGSPDNCGKIIDEYASKDERIKPIHKENGGYGSAVNAGLAAATGEYIGIVETDDWCEPTMFEKLYNKAKETEADLVKCYFNISSVDNKNRKYEINYFYSLKDTFEYTKDARISLFHASVWCGLYKKSMLKENNIIMSAEKGSYYQDNYWSTQCYYCSNKISIIKENLYNWRVEEGQDSSTRRKDEKLFNMITMLDRSLDFLKSQQNYNNEILEAFSVNAFLSIYGFFNQIDDSLKEKYYNNMRAFLIRIKNEGFTCKYNNFNNVKNIIKIIQKRTYKQFLFYKILYKFTSIFFEIKENTNFYRVKVFGIRILKIKKNNK